MTWCNSTVSWIGIPGPCRNIKTVFPRYGITLLKVRWSQDRLIFEMGIPIRVRRLYIDMNPSSPQNTWCQCQLKPNEPRAGRQDCKFKKFSLVKMDVITHTVWLWNKIVATPCVDLSVALNNETDQYHKMTHVAVTCKAAGCQSCKTGHFIITLRNVFSTAGH